MTFSNWMLDIPHQFHGKRNIEVLINAFSKQLDEVLQVFEDLNVSTTLDNAIGKNLEYVGDILSTSKTEAQLILKSAGNEEITDEKYRKVLQYKALQNNCDCTYYDIMDSMSILWDVSKVKYVENPEKPATIYIELPAVNVDGIDPAVGRILAIKPAGVSMIYTVGYVTEVNISSMEGADAPSIFIKITPIEFAERIESDLELSVSSKVTETVEASIATYENYWMLDGTYLLNGTKMLNAKKHEEVL